MELYRLRVGIPQGSPISRLLLLRYMSELMKIGKSRALFGYANDIGILGIGRTILESVTVA